MAKSTQNLDVNIVLSKCEFIGVAAFESIKLGIWKLAFSQVLASPFAEVISKNAILSKYAAGQNKYFEDIQNFQRQMRGNH